MRRKAEQPILGIVAARPVKKPTPFQTEMMRRQQLGGHAPSILSPGQQITARRRADREEAYRTVEVTELPGDYIDPSVFTGVLRRMR